MFDTYLQSMRNLLQSYRLRSWVFSLVFGVFVVSIFYLLQWLIPENIPNYYETITVLFIIISVILLFPTREAIAKKFLKSSDYFNVQGKEFHHLDFIARQFTVNTLLNEITPELMEWLNIRSGQIAILDPDRRNFNFHKFVKGKAAKSRINIYPLIEDHTAFLRKHRLPIFYDAVDTPEQLREFMDKKRIRVLVPFVYRNRLLGFLMLKTEPRNKYAYIALETYAGKAAVSIQNYILSSKIIDNEHFEQEFQAAGKIQNLLQFTRIPAIPGFKLKKLKDDQHPIIIEIFQSNENRWLFVFLCSPRLTSAAGILLFGILGVLYSVIRREKQLSIHKLSSLLKNDPRLNRSEYRIDILIAELEADRDRLSVLTDGKTFRLKDPQDPDRRNIFPGWRNYIKLKPDRSLFFEYADTPLLEITPTSTSNDGGADL